MLAIHGYYDGTAIRPLEKLNAKPNQRVIITIIDEFIEPETKPNGNGMRGALAEYADPALIEKEKGAWERAAVDANL